MRTTAIAIESASPRIQKKIRKHLNLEKTRQSINYMCEKGIYLSTYNMIGFPSEIPEEIRQTLEFNTSLPHHALIVFAVTPHEGTELYNLAVSEGFIPQNYNIGNYWQPDRIDDSFRAVSTSFVQIMLVKFVMEFYFTKRRLQINLEIMSKNKDNHFFIISIKRIFTNLWDIFCRAIPRKRKEEINELLNKLLNF